MKIVQRTRHLAQEVVHFGRLGKVASQRGFLNRERKKLLLKLGEKCLERLHEGALQDRELARLVGPIEKIEKLLAESDYGGQDGQQFSRSPGAKIKTKNKSRLKKTD